MKISDSTLIQDKQEIEKILKKIYEISANKKSTIHQLKVNITL